MSPTWAACWADSAGAPDVVEAILDGRQPPETTLAVLMRPFAVAWTAIRSDALYPALNGE
jgi:hypothetical protein